MTPLSPAAIRLLEYLRAVRAHEPATAKTDAAISEETGIAHRTVIDAAGELLDAGYLVLAGETGRYLLLPGGDLAAAHVYMTSLRSRAVQVFRRRRAVRRAIALYMLARAGGRPRQLDLLFSSAPPASLREKESPCV